MWKKKPEVAVKTHDYGSSEPLEKEKVQYIEMSNEGEVSDLSSGTEDKEM